MTQVSLDRQGGRDRSDSVQAAGPTDALSTAGTQYITAAATAGPSGVAGIYCSLDNAPYIQHAGANVRIPIQGKCVERLYQRCWRGINRVWDCS